MEYFSLSLAIESSRVQPLRSTVNYVRVQIAPDCILENLNFQFSRGSMPRTPLVSRPFGNRQWCYRANITHIPSYAPPRKISRRRPWNVWDHMSRVNICSGGSACAGIIEIECNSEKTYVSLVMMMSWKMIYSRHFLYAQEQILEYSSGLWLLLIRLLATIMTYPVI